VRFARIETRLSQAHAQHILFHIHTPEYWRDDVEVVPKDENHENTGALVDALFLQYPPNRGPSFYNLNDATANGVLASTLSFRRPSTSLVDQSGHGERRPSNAGVSTAPITSESLSKSIIVVEAGSAVILTNCVRSCVSFSTGPPMPVHRRRAPSISSVPLQTVAERTENVATNSGLDAPNGSDYDTSAIVSYRRQITVKNAAAKTPPP